LKERAGKSLELSKVGSDLNLYFQKRQGTVTRRISVEASPLTGRTGGTRTRNGVFTTPSGKEKKESLSVWGKPRPEESPSSNGKRDQKEGKRGEEKRSSCGCWGEGRTSNGRNREERIHVRVTDHRKARPGREDINTSEGSQGRKGQSQIKRGFEEKKLTFTYLEKKIR